MQPIQADSELKEEHLVNFIVNSLDDELPVELNDGVEVTVDDLYEVLVGASADEDLYQSHLRDDR